MKMKQPKSKKSNEGIVASSVTDMRAKESSSGKGKRGGSKDSKGGNKFTPKKIRKSVSMTGTVASLEPSDTNKIVTLFESQAKLVETQERLQKQSNAEYAKRFSQIQDHVMKSEAKFSELLSVLAGQQANITARHRKVRESRKDRVPSAVNILESVKGSSLSRGSHSSGTFPASHMSDGDAADSASSTKSDDDIEIEERQRKYDSAFLTLLTSIIIMYIVVGTWVVPAIFATVDDGYWLRCFWFLTAPLTVAVMLFPFKMVVFSTGMILGSYRNVDENSSTHSAKKPPVPKVLPKIIVQMPVYKESFEETIKPSLDNIYRCIKYYRDRGGESGMFINDDGLQLISEEDRQERIDYYNKYNIAYIARPSPKELARRGLFKKASNMNFCLNFALEVNQVENDLGLSKEEAIQHVIDSRPYPVLAGGPIGMERIKNILLVDSDTRVPKACLYDTVGEFYICEKLGFCQHTISVLRVEDTYWEDWLADFTDKLYNLYVALGTSNGDPPPLVGHNATLSWDAMQEASWFDEEVNYRCWWSEMHVSEDFDMSLRLQSLGYCGRFIMYTGSGFKEGVSVQVFDEIIKLKKYAYGTGEMLFNKIKDWPKKGPFNPLIKRYIRSTVPADAKVNILSYLFTYIAMTWGVLCVPLSIYVSTLAGVEQHMQLTSFEIFTGCLLIFGFIGNSTTIVLEYLRGRTNSICLEAFTQVKNFPICTLFFSGLLFHICEGMLRYLLDMKAEWGATSKELDDMEYTLQRFPIQVWETIKRFRVMYITLLIFSASLAIYFLCGPPYLSWGGFAMTPFMMMITTHAFMPILLDFTAMYCLWHPLKKAFGFGEDVEDRREDGTSNVIRAEMNASSSSESSMLHEAESGKLGLEEDDDDDISVLSDYEDCAGRRCRVSNGVLIMFMVCTLSGAVAIAATIFNYLQ